jgi:putative oxidoreductase
MNLSTLDPWSPRVLAVLRIITGLLFLQHGLMKLFAFPGPQPGAADHLSPLLLTAAGMELVGGPLLACGLLTRPVAFLLSGEMAVAYWLVHAPRGFWPGLNGGEPAILYCFVFLYFVVSGPGAWSLDARLADWPIGRALGTRRETPRVRG